MKQAHGGCQRAESTDSTWLAQDADPLPRAGQSSASAGKKRRGRPEGTRPRRVPRSVAVVPRVRPFPGGAGHSGEPEIASSPPLKLSVTTSHTWRFL